MTVVPLPAARQQEQQKMAPFRWWLFCAATVLCVVLKQGCAQRLGLLSRWRKCVLPHERRARLWERYERYCVDGRRLEWRRRKGGCICKDGYYRDEETQNCFEDEHCGQCSSARHESFNSCLGCELICGQPVIQQCDSTCKPGCQCVKGYIRRRRGGRCVPIMSCPPRCPIYMRFVRNRERCPRVCNEAREDTCLASNEGPGCVCRPGFVLKAIFGTIRTNDWCIHESMCRFPDEEPPTNKGGAGDDVKGSTGDDVKGGTGGDVKGGWDGATKGSEDNFPNDQSKGGGAPHHAPSEPKMSDTNPFGDQNKYPPLPDLKGWKGQNWMNDREPSEPTKSGKDLFGQNKGFPPLPDLKGWKGQNWRRAPEASHPEKGGHDALGSSKGFPPLPDLKGWGSRDSLTVLQSGSRTKGHKEGEISTKGGYPSYPGFEEKPPEDWFIAGDRGQGSRKGTHTDEGLVPTKITDNWWQSKEGPSYRSKGSLFDVDVFPRKEAEESSRSKGRPASRAGGKGAADEDAISKVPNEGVTVHKHKMEEADQGQTKVNLNVLNGAPNYQEEGLRMQEKVSEGFPLKLLALQTEDKLAVSKTSSQTEVTEGSKKPNDKPLEAKANITNSRPEKPSSDPSKSRHGRKNADDTQNGNLFFHGASLLQNWIGAFTPAKQSSEPSKTVVNKKEEDHKDTNIISHGANIVHKLIGTGIGMGTQFFSGLKNVASIGGLVDHSLNVLASGMHSLTGSGGPSKSNSEQKKV